MTQAPQTQTIPITLHVLGGRTVDTEIAPGQTVGDILRSANLEGFWVVRGPQGGFFSYDEALYPHVRAGEKLQLVTANDLGHTRTRG